MPTSENQTPEDEAKRLSEAIRKAELRAAGRAAAKCEEIALIYFRHGGAGAGIAVTALRAAADAVLREGEAMVRESRRTK